MELSDFDYRLPEESIAQEPLADRAASRMLVVNRKEQRWEDHLFRELPEFLKRAIAWSSTIREYFRAGCTAIARACTRCRSERKSKRRENLSGRVEVLLLRPVSADAERMAGAGTAGTKDAHRGAGKF